MNDISDTLDEPAQSDGRRQRSQRSRQKIVAAMLSLVRGGEISPSAAQVAEESGVSLRTVFRHFEEMDSLYREMSTIIEAEIMPILSRPLKASDWRDQIGQLIDRRIDVFERIMPLKVSGSVRRFQSEYLKKDYEQFLALEREGLMQVVPKSIQKDQRVYAALELALSFEAWRYMRQDRALTPKQAEAATRFSVEKLLSDH